MNCEKQKCIYLCFGLIKAYLHLCKNIKKNSDKKSSVNNEDIQKRKNIIITNIFYDLLIELRKYNIVLPVKMLLYKNYLLQSILSVLHSIVKIFNKEILSMNPDKFIFYNDIGFIKDLTETINSSFFLLGNDILYYLKFPIENNNSNEKNKYIFYPGVTPYLRIVDESNQINYYNIRQTKIFGQKYKTSRTNSIKDFPPLFSNKFGNDIIFEDTGEVVLENPDIEKVNENNLFEDKKEQIQDNNGKMIDKNGYTIMPLNIFQTNIFKTEAKKKKYLEYNEYIFRYDITPIVDNFKNEQLLSLSKIGFNYKIEDDHHYLYINTEENFNINYSQIIIIRKKDASCISLNNSGIYNSLKNESLSSQVIEQLFVNLLDGLDDTNKGNNSKITLKYYDTNFNMDYFTFVEKCKEIIL